VHQPDRSLPGVDHAGPGRHHPQHAILRAVNMATKIDYSAKETLDYSAKETLDYIAFKLLPTYGKVREQRVAQRAAKAAAKAAEEAAAEAAAEAAEAAAAAAAKAAEAEVEEQKRQAAADKWLAARAACAAKRALGELRAPARLRRGNDGRRLSE
jgi:hypothetical protein